MSATTRVLPPRRASRSDRTVPFIYGAIALLLGVILLPTILRPPQDQPQTSSAFSPDAPPDKNQSSIFSSFRVAGSGTAAGVTQTAGEPGAAVTTTTTTPPKLVASACPYGFGNPPRQIESIYAPPCAPAFKGDNGGSTADGISSEAINVCFLMELTGTVSNDGEDAARITRPTTAPTCARTRCCATTSTRATSSSGRQLHFFYPTSDSSQSGDAQARARADKAADTDHCFAAVQETNPAASDELAKRQILHFTVAQTPEKWFAEHDPYLWSFTPSGSQDVRLGAEYACKKLAHKPPSFTDDPTLTGAKERHFGAIVYNLPAYDNPGPQIKALMAECGVNVDPIVTYDLTGGQASTAGLASAITAMQARRHDDLLPRRPDLCGAIHAERQVEQLLPRVVHPWLRWRRHRPHRPRLRPERVEARVRLLALRDPQARRRDRVLQGVPRDRSEQRPRLGHVHLPTGATWCSCSARSRPPVRT